MRSWIALVAAALVGGCFSDDEVIPPPAPDAACVDPGAAPPPDGKLSGPEALPREGCDPGALAGLDPSGLWYVEGAAERTFGIGPVRFQLDCYGGLSAQLSSLTSSVEAGHALLTADDLFWRRERNLGESFVRTDAFGVCRVEEDGSLAGYHAACFEDLEQQEEFCSDEPIRLSRFGRIPGEPEAEGLEIVAEHAGRGASSWPEAFTANVRVRDGVAYLARGEDGLRVVDVSDPEAPADLGHWPAPEEDMNDVKLAEGPGGALYALLASDRSGVHVVDVTEPTAPEPVAFFSSTGAPDHGAHTLFVESQNGRTLAYLADGYTPFLAIFDVTDPASPMMAGGYTAMDEEWGLHDLYVEGGRAYLNATYGGLILVDTLPDPSSPTLIGRYARPTEPYSHSNWVTAAGGRLVSVHGDEGYGAHLEVIDVDPDSPEFLTRLGDYETRPTVSIHNIQAFGERAYVAYYQDGVRVLDLADPTAPEEIAHYNTWDPETAPGAVFEGAVGIDAHPDSGLIYVADHPRGLVILRLTR